MFYLYKAKNLFLNQEFSGLMDYCKISHHRIQSFLLDNERGIRQMEKCFELDDCIFSFSLKYPCPYL